MAAVGIAAGKFPARAAATTTRPGLAKVVPPDAAATFLIAQGVPLRVVIEILGHSTISVTADTYGHVMLEAQREATERTAAVLFGT
jgi:integrase